MVVFLGNFCHPDFRFRGTGTTQGKGRVQPEQSLHPIIDEYFHDSRSSLKKEQKLLVKAIFLEFLEFTRIPMMMRQKNLQKKFLFYRDWFLRFGSEHRTCQICERMLVQFPFPVCEQRKKSVKRKLPVRCLM